MDTLERREKDYEGLAAQIGTPPRQLEYIEARGFLCHELLHLLGGAIEFVGTPWRQWVLKIMEAFCIPISPICRWLPPEGSVLECVGTHRQAETRVYRLTPDGGAVVVFFVEYRPEHPAGGTYVRSAFSVPQLDLWKFLRPPFDLSNSSMRIAGRLRGGLTQGFSPLVGPDSARHVEEMHLAMCRGIWKGFASLP